jgi:hypothetical protein
MHLQIKIKKIINIFYFQCSAFICGAFVAVAVVVVVVVVVAGIDPGVV